MRVSYAQSVHGQEEKNLVCKALDENRLAPGTDVLEFEKRIAGLFGKAHGIMVNSGSSANLLALELLDLLEGSEVITPALTFATTVAPILQKRLKPVFVDVVPGRYIVDAQAVVDAITPETRAILIPSLIGNIPDMKALRNITFDYELGFIEDSCDTLGAMYRNDPTGVYSDISTTSFYGAHIITAGGSGGMLCVNRPDWNDRARMLRGWGRSSATFGESESLDNRFGHQVDGIEYDAKYIFSEIGYNFQPSELNASFGLAQLDKLPEFAKRRYCNYHRLLRFFRAYDDFFILPEQTYSTQTSWLAFPLTLKTDRFTRKQITTFLEKRDIQTRPIFTGNILRQPAYQNAGSGEFPVADAIMKNGFLLGCHHGLTDDQLDYMEDVLKEFLNEV